MAERLITLEAWAHLRYADHVPNIQTLRRWAREAKIFPIPKKHGRTYYLSERARYVDDYNDPDLVRVLRESTTT